MRFYKDTECKTCHKHYMKASDTFKTWLGECGICTRKTVAKRPEVKEAQRLNGIAVMARVGTLPHPLDRYRRGPQVNTWRGGITSEYVRARNSPATKEWRKAVFTRDGYACVACGSSNHDLEADHIQPFSLFPELRYEINNGRTLCKPCHRLYGVRVRGGKIIKESVPVAKAATAK